MRTIDDMRRSELNRGRHVCPNQPLIHLFRVTDTMQTRLAAHAVHGSLVPSVRESVITEELEHAARSGRKVR